jgi:hypothetical protein
LYLIKMNLVQRFKLFKAEIWFLGRRVTPPEEVMTLVMGSVYGSEIHIKPPPPPSRLHVMKSDVPSPLTRLFTYVLSGSAAPHDDVFIRAPVQPGILATLLCPFRSTLTGKTSHHLGGMGIFQLETTSRYIVQGS